MKTIKYGPATKDGRYVENASNGLRFIGASHEVAKSIQHTGWYLSEDNWPGETVHGGVWQLPARKGTPQYVGGYIAPYIDEGATICFTDITDDPITAAIWADRMAEREAETAREDDRAFREEQQREDEFALKAAQDDAQSEIEELERVA